MKTTMTVRGQTVVPAAIRKAYDLEPESRIEWIDDGKCIRVVPLGRDVVRESRGVYGKGMLRKALVKARAEDRARE